MEKSYILSVAGELARRESPRETASKLAGYTRTWESKLLRQIRNNDDFFQEQIIPAVVFCDHAGDAES